MNLEGKLHFTKALCLATFILFNTLTMSPAYAVAVTEVYLVPSTISSNLEWNVTAWVKNIPSINATFAFQIALSFNNSLLDCIGVWIPESEEAWIFSGLATISLAPTINNDGGFAAVGDLIVSGESVSGSGPFSLGVFEFCLKIQFDDDPISHVNFSNPDTYLLNDALVEISPVKKTGGSVNVREPTLTAIRNSRIPDLQSGEYSNPTEELRHFVRTRDAGGSIDLIVGLNNEVPNSYEEVEALAEEHGGKILDTISTEDKITSVLVNITSDRACSFISKVEAAGLSIYVEPNHMFSTMMIPNDPYWEYQWGPKKIQADWAWNTTLGNATVLVSVVDSGIDYNHTDLKDNYVKGGCNWLDSTDPKNPMDYFGHGTHVAGIIAAVTNNSEGIAGLAQVGIMAEKVISFEELGGDEFTIARGVWHAADMGARVISISLGSYFYPYVLYDAVKHAVEKGALIVAAAGNEAVSGTSYPAYFKEVIAVTATDQNDVPADFTNFGNWVELAAPGVDINSTLPNNDYGSFSGTSMACPHVSGVAALILSKYPNMTRDQVRIHLRKTADDLGPPGFDINYGYGRVNARKAVEQNLPRHDVLIQDWDRIPYVKLGNVTVNASVLNYGVSDESNVTVQLLLNSSLAISKTIDYLPSGNSSIVQLSWPAPSEGVYNVTVYAVPVSGESDTADNAVWAYVGTDSGIIRVPDYYPTIQEAVDAASPGDTVRVSSGIFNEAVHIYTMDISLIGESPETTVINGSRWIYGIWVVYTDDSPYFSVENFTIQNSGSSHPYAGILLSSSHCTASDNYVVNNTRGISIEVLPFRSWPVNCTVSDNCVTNNTIGIYMAATSSNNITGNQIINSDMEGIKLYEKGYNNRISGNTIELNGNVGIRLDPSQGGNSIVSNNLVQRNAYGILVRSGTVTGNKVVENTAYGIKLKGSGNTVKDNHFRDNGQGIDISESASNSIYWNNFITNTDQAYGTLLNEWHGHWNVSGNYWSDYNGTDSDSDGFGDTPHIIDASNTDNFPFMDPYLPGDITHDGKVDIKDVAIVAKAYGSKLGDPRWNPHADLKGDGLIDIVDLNIVCSNYGQYWWLYWEE